MRASQAGLIANMLIPGRRQQGLILTCVIGIVGALPAAMAPIISQMTSRSVPIRIATSDGSGQHRSVRGNEKTPDLRAAATFSRLPPPGSGATPLLYAPGMIKNGRGRRPIGGRCYLRIGPDRAERLAGRGRSHLDGQDAKAWIRL